MSFDVIGVGTNPNDNTGDTLRAGGVKINANFAKAVEGPASVAAGLVAGFDGTSGKLVQGGVGDGTAAAPSLVFASDLDTGVFRATTNELAISTNGVEKLRVSSGAVVILGNGDTASSPAATTLRATDASGSNVAGAALTIRGGRGTGTGAGGALIFQTTPTGSSGSSLNTSTERMRILASGNVGVGTASPATRFHVDGTIRYTNRPTTGTITAIGFDTNGDLRASSSSLRYKHDVVDYEKGLDAVLSLRPVSFKFDGEERENIGFVAEEIDELGLSEVMLYDDIGRPEGVLYSNMVALLTRAVQELSGQVEGLRAQVLELSGG
jgi:hypothetical protein